MPYYRFYVELPEEKRAGLNNYGSYYVPAVEKEYLTNMPVWDGSFNQYAQNLAEMELIKSSNLTKL